MDFSNKKIIVFFLAIILTVSLFLILRNISDPFIRFSEDNNALHGLSARNWLKFGVFELKFGIAPHWINSLEEDISYYTNHPGFFTLPTIFFYRILGVNEIATRISPLIFAILSLIVFFFLIHEAYKDYLLSFLSSFVFATLPALTFYGKMLNHEIFVLFFALLCFYLFFKAKNSNKNYFLYLLLASIFTGGLMGWHFFFIPAIIWFLVLLDKPYPKRKVLIFIIPLIAIACFSLIVLHLHVLRGENALISLGQGFIQRTSGLPWGFWFDRMWLLLKLNFTLPILLLGIYWAIYSAFQSYKNKKISLDLAFLAFPLLVAIIFRQWVTHPYGPFYFLAFFSLAAGKIFYLAGSKASDIFKKETYSLALVTLILAFQFYFGFAGLRFFDENLILDKDSINLLKEIKEQYSPKLICVGREQSGLGYTHIFSFYLKAKVLRSPQCLEKNLPLAIVFNPQMGEFFEKETELFFENGYKSIKCQGVICLLEKEL